MSLTSYLAAPSRDFELPHTGCGRIIWQAERDVKQKDGKNSHTGRKTRRRNGSVTLIVVADTLALALLCGDKHAVDLLGEFAADGFVHVRALD